MCNKKAFMNCARGILLQVDSIKWNQKMAKKLVPPSLYYRHHRQMLASRQKSWLGPMITFASHLLEIPFRWFWTKIKFCSIWTICSVTTDNAVQWKNILNWILTQGWSKLTQIMSIRVTIICMRLLERKMLSKNVFVVHGMNNLY